jgi:hypothetical protein
MGSELKYSQKISTSAAHAQEHTATYRDAFNIGVVACIAIDRDGGQAGQTQQRRKGRETHDVELGPNGWAVPKRELG